MSGDPMAAALSALEHDYEIVREIGRGGTALVYLARERSSGSEVAIKVIRAKYVEDEETLARFAREARYVGDLHHPNVVALRSVVELGDLGLALVMDHVRGKTLKQMIQENGPLAPPQAESVLRDIASALRAAHAMRIVHRDVKPENIFIDTEGRALLADFGVARSMTNDTQLTMSGIAIGTPAYMAPEQIDGIPLDGRGDIYSLGLVGWEMLTGKRPWEGSSLYAVIYQQKHEHLPDVRDMRAGVPDRLAEVIAGAIEKDRAARWQNADEFIAALDGMMPQRAVQPRPVLTDQTRRFARPSAPARDEKALASAVAVSGLLANAGPRNSNDRKPSMATRRRLMAGGGMSVAIAFVALMLFVSSGRTDVAARASPEAAAASRPSPRSPETSANDLERWPGMPDARYQETLEAIGPEAAVADPSAAPRGSADPAVSGQSASREGVEAPPKPADNKSPARDNADSAPEELVNRAVATPPPAFTAPPPSRPSPPSTRVSIATGGSHTCLVTASGRAYCWGGNDRGQLGSGSTTRHASPSAVGADLRFAAVAPGLSHSCAIARGGAAWCWGENAHGQLGDRTLTSRLSPVLVADNHAFRSLDAGAAHTCGLDGAGKVWCWGSNTHGQLGVGDGHGESATPVAVAIDRRFTSIALGWSFSCALDAAGRVMCWGDNTAGQLGDGTRDDRRKPTAARASISFTAITAGSGHACGLNAVGEAYCWGRNTRGQLGDGTKTDRTMPVHVKAPVRFVAISAGAVHTCAVSADGTAYCWGQNTYGQLGDGGTTDRTEPVLVVRDHAFALVRAFGSHTCGATTSGEVFCWGYNLDGQLGDGTRAHRARPVYVEPPIGQ
jgi:serine/threonine protein kinase/alpha-tubulin suppressor-like RCC1 family protein